MTSLLARPQWRIGQVLLPDHFKGLELSLMADAALRSSTSGLPTTGLLRLVWSGPTPKNGMLYVEELVAILKDNLLVDVPGNASIAGPLDLKLSGRSQVVVYAHVFSQKETAIQKGFEPRSEEIERHFYQVQLSAEPSRPNSLARIDLGLFTRKRDGTFELSSKVVPELLRLDATPYFKAELDAVRRQIGSFEAALTNIAHAAMARGESLMPVQRVRIEARKLIALLDDMRESVPHHPYVVYNALRTFALELCVLDGNAEPWEQPPAYRHHALGACFDAVFGEIETRLSTPPPESPCVPFELENGRWIASIPPEAMAAPELFIAARKVSMNELNPLEGVRLASPERLRHVREHVLRGVRILFLEKAPFLNAFGPGVDFYQIVLPGIGEVSPEWTYVKQEGRLAFYHDPRLEGHSFLLCWRRR